MHHGLKLDVAGGSFRLEEGRDHVTKRQFETWQTSEPYFKAQIILTPEGRWEPHLIGLTRTLTQEVSRKLADARNHTDLTAHTASSDVQLKVAAPLRATAVARKAAKIQIIVKGK